MKRNKHITVNMDENLYNMIQYLSDMDRRKASEYLFLLVNDEINKRIIKAVDIKNDGFKKLKV